MIGAGDQINKDRLKVIQNLSYRLGFQCNNFNLLHNAFTHSSYKNENENEIFDNERLEFLGDSVINLIVVDFLYVSYSYSSEGYLSYLKSNLICSECLSRISKKLNLISALLVGKGVDKAILAEKAYADVLEALLGFIYLDQGYIKAKNFFLPHIKKEIFNLEKKKITSKNHKIKLQEYSQKKWKQLPIYQIQDVIQKQDYQLFTTQVQIQINDKYKAIGVGTSKKESEINAAFNLMDKFKFS